MTSEPDSELKATNPSPTRPLRPYPLLRVRLGLSLTLFGFLVFLLGARPSVYGLDRSPVVGFVQIAVFLVGLAIICLGGYISLNALWNGRQRSIPADIGMRLVSTGYVIAVFTAMADIFGLGLHGLADEMPYFGPWQAMGVQIAEGVIALGFLMMIPFGRGREKVEAEPVRK